MPSRIFSLTKFFLSLAIAFSSVAGFIFRSHGFMPEVLLCAAGVFFLASGAAVLNQYQERKPDALMERTKNRPIPSGAISPQNALIIACILSLAGMIILWVWSGWLPALLGALNLAWYNGVYTPLKRRSYFAVLAGAVNGAVPPLIGWVAAGGRIADPKILFIAFFILVWQIPHFWLLLLMHGGEYKKAGFYAITDGISAKMQPIILLAWIFATAISTLFLPLFGIIRSVPLIISIITAGCVLVPLLVLLPAKRAAPANYRTAFIIFNVFMVAVFLVLLAESMLA
jgi:protoheme IX farnesyltransferase